MSLVVFLGGRGAQWRRHSGGTKEFVCRRLDQSSWGKRIGPVQGDSPQMGAWGMDPRREMDRARH